MEDAILEYNNVLVQDPDLVEAYIWRGTAKSLLRRYFEAITDFNDALLIKTRTTQRHTISEALRKDN